MPMLVASFSEDSVRWAIRRSVDIAFVFFFLSFGASAIQLLFQSTFSAWLLRNRRYLGISFGIAFLTHASLILLLANLYPEPFMSDITAGVIYMGITAFSLTALMTVSSNNAAVKLLGRRLWTSLHTVGGYFLLVIFTTTYLGKLEHAFFWPFSLAVVSLICLRLYKITNRLKAKT
ncbi:hypothetical protein A9Q79_09455 [Methylophaga sp. 42_25_T18]|nr:hypothetical protein A9Q79_09455 [Methylophaga sp. 42_25_T18]OUR88028.1 hypothetical protein A9Q92_03525 [Methylophaga sp. 42_8_T64]